MTAESSSTEVSSSELLPNDNETVFETPRDEKADAIGEPPDGGYGWVIVVAVFFVHVFVLGNVYSFGVLYPVLIEAFHSNKGNVAWVGSIAAALMVGLGAWTGSLADRYGNNRIIALGACCIGLGYALGSLAQSLWHLYLTLGLITGFGYSFAFISAVSVVGQWFTKRRGLALGTAVAGSGLGQFAMSQITGALLQSFSWRGALLVLALINFVGLMICALFIKRLLPLVKHDVSSKVSSLDNFKDRNFLLLFLGAFVNSLGAFMPYSHLPIYSENHNKSISIYSLHGWYRQCMWEVQLRLVCGLLWQTTYIANMRV
jgi:MFS family permease